MIEKIHPETNHGLLEDHPITTDHVLVSEDPPKTDHVLLKITTYPVLVPDQFSIQIMFYWKILPSQQTMF